MMILLHDLRDLFHEYLICLQEVPASLKLLVADSEMGEMFETWTVPDVLCELPRFPHKRKTALLLWQSPSQHAEERFHSLICFTFLVLLIHCQRRVQHEHTLRSPSFKGSVQDVVYVGNSWAISSKIVLRRRFPPLFQLMHERHADGNRVPSASRCGKDPANDYNPDGIKREFS